MNAATWPRDVPHTARLLHVRRSNRSLSDRGLLDLPEILAPGDLLVLNDAATLPASLQALDGSYELRLMAYSEPHDTWHALLLGAGDHRIPTEQRANAPNVGPSDTLTFGAALKATVIEASSDRPALLRVRFNLKREQFFRALYAAGHPIQYAYVRGPLELWHVQNRFAGSPWAFENPSAGFGLTWEVLSGLRKRGIGWATLTHAAGISSTGSSRLDQCLPLAERYVIPERTVQAVVAAQRAERRIVAVGTTVVRALEANALQHGSLRAGPGVAKLLLGPGFQPRVTQALLTGMHERTTSHFALLQAFADTELLEASLAHAERAGYLQHEFGDVCLIE